MLSAHSAENAKNTAIAEKREENPEILTKLVRKRLTRQGDFLEGAQFSLGIRSGVLGCQCFLWAHCTSTKRMLGARCFQNGHFGYISSTLYLECFRGSTLPGTLSQPSVQGVFDIDSYNLLEITLKRL